LDAWEAWIANAIANPIIPMEEVGARGDEIIKCNVNEKTIMGIRYYFGLVRK
jgi:hypothetical protein